ncbi:hypothetical protein F0562_009068 [Nyssa sinensis]|uniref:DYW domain-containing protein n=1 Tax=Nyssa sinensis TaxID=561372 RepID=A0A5J5A742_9ASTE|nr:hypothetical protein F0562_009068 [Nyssa sinensis]
MYAHVGNWDDMAKVRKLMRDRRVKKEPGCSWIEVENKVHVFLVDDAMHPEVQAVYNYLEQLRLEMRKLGYVPDTKFVLHDMESEHKEYVLSTHSEKLAVVFGLLKLPLEATVRVFKNLKICGDCHNAFKFMSKVVAREIVVRDGKRFHHFRNAINLINSMPFEPHSGAWGALLGASSTHLCLDLAKLAAQDLFELEPNNGTPYVVLSNIYSVAGFSFSNVELKKGGLEVSGLLAVIRASLEASSSINLYSETLRTERNIEGKSCEPFEEKRLVSQQETTPELHLTLLVSR